MKRIALAAFGILLLTAPAAANRYMEPIDPPLEADASFPLTRIVFQRAYDADVQIRVLIFPAFFPASVAGIDGGPGHHRIFVVREPRAVFGDLRTGFKFRAVPARSFEAPITDTLARRILTVWTAMLQKTEPSDVIGNDGVDFYFAVKDGAVWRGAHQWGFDERVGDAIPNTNPFRMLDIANLMAAYARTRDAQVLHRLGARIADIESHLDDGVPK